MGVPTARVRGWVSSGIQDPALLFIQPNASATAPLVRGESFVDASDGSVESHYSTWSLDGAGGVAQLPSVPFGAGPCGSHTLSFTAVYGAYANFTSRTTPDFTVGVSNIQYAVRPFASRITVVSSDASGIRFRPNTRVGTSAVAEGTGAKATILWELVNASGGPVRTSPLTSTLGDVTEFFVSSAELTTGNSVRLTVTVDPSLILDAGCASMTASSDSVQLLVPDPALTVSGCTTVGAPCSITASSASGQNRSGWTYTWSLNGDEKKLATGSTYTPSSSEIGEANKSYRVNVRVRNDAGISTTSADATFSLEPALCTNKPDGLSFTWAGTEGSCLPGTCTSANTLDFNPKAWGYTFQDCDSFNWSFGDGTSSSDKYPRNKKYAADGSYTVRLTVTNSEGSSFVEQAVTLGSSPPPTNPPPTNPPPTNPPTSGCDAPSQMLGFNMTGGTTGCTGLIGAPDCAVSEVISFTAVNFPQSKSFQSCDSFAWDFGDGSTSNQQSPGKIYTVGGSYTVKLTVSNAAGSVLASLPIKVTGTSGGGGDPNCKTPTDRAYIEFSAPSGCSGAAGSVPCNPGETVTLTLKTVGEFQACDSFDWAFGDGTTIPASKNTIVQHQFPATQPEYTVTVTIKNTAGSSTVTEKVRFGLLGADKPTSVDFSWSGTTPVVGSPVTFTATATAPAAYPVTSWQWSFGDGVTASGNPVQHTFSTEDTWPVTLTASNAGGSAAPLTKQVKVLKANAFTYLLPVVSHLDGANGSKWRTDLQIYNGNVGEGDVELECELTNVQGMKKNFSLKLSTLIYEDFMSFFRDDNWAGPVVIRGAAPHDLQIWTRTYSVGASGIGTYGHLIPAVRIDGNQGFTAGETILYLTGAAATEKYRTNLYLLNITAQPMPVTITAYDGQFGAAVGQLSKEVAPFQLTPISASEISGIPSTRPFSLSIKGTSDGLIAYESVIDNGSNDPIYIPAISTGDLGDPAMRNQVLPSVGHAGPWKSDVTIFNPDDQAIQFDLLFYKDTTGELLAEAKDQILPAKGLLQLDDIIWSDKLNPLISTDVIGTLRVNIDSPLADQFLVVAQRNYSDSGDTKRFGQGILGFAAAKPNVATGKPAILPAVRSDQLYRSNVGLVNVGTTDANATISLLDPNSGQTIGMYSLSLKPNESRILPDMIRFLHQTADRGSIKVEVTNEASVWAFATIIDKSTSDPEYVPAIPLN
jgi:PKD repeat protein